MLTHYKYVRFEAKETDYSSVQLHCIGFTSLNHKKRFTFTGKERDSETGYSYFGARYYDSGIPNIFLSVDPMADKNPSISPYAYCAWNPIKLVDPDGMELVLIGDAECVKKAMSMMSAILDKKSKMSFSVDGKGRVSYSGEAKTKVEKYIAKIIDNTDITVNLTVQESNKDKNGDIIYGGSFDGNKFKTNAKDKINAYQTVDLISAGENDLKVGEEWRGQTIWHEISEAFEGGNISIQTGKEAQIAYKDKHNAIYEMAHYNASKTFPASPKAILEQYQTGMFMKTKIIGYEFE